MFLDYFALCLLLLMATGLFYVFFYIHDIPYDLAEKRDHPQKDAIYWGCWLSLFTLHVLWPFIFLWAVSKPPKVESTKSESSDDETSASGKSRDGSTSAEIAQLRKQIAALQDRLAKVERQADPAGVSHD